MKKQFWGIGIILMVLFGGSFSLQAAASTATPTSWRLPWQLDNGDFETIDFDQYGQSAGAPYEWYVQSEGVEGWGTYNPDGKIEVWQNGNNSGLDARSGTNFVELNSDRVGPIYQDIKTIPGSRLVWEFSHRGRQGVDTASLLIGSTDNQAVITTVSDGKDAWGDYSGTYIVPEGQFVTRLTFVPVSTSSGDQTIGNFLDDIELYIDVVGASIGDYVWYDQNGDGIQQDDEPPVTDSRVTLWQDGMQIADTMTNEIGAYLFSDIAPGDYQVKFELPEGTKLTYTREKQGDNTQSDSDVDHLGVANVNIPLGIRYQDITIDAGITSESSASVQAVTTDRQPLADAEFVLNNQYGESFPVQITEENGRGFWEGLRPGNYTLTEKRAPAGYQPLTTSQDFTILFGQQRPSELTFEHTLVKGDLHILLRDQTSHEPLADGEFQLMDQAGKKIGTGKTDQNGQIDFQGLVPGVYQIEQTKAPATYIKDSNRQSVTIPFDPKTAVDVIIENKKMTDGGQNSDPSNGTNGDLIVNENMTDSPTSTAESLNITKLVETGEKADNGASVFLGALLVGIGSFYLIRRK
ncbi:MSCRAMM family protein [Listeria ilorinensis]|uniref:MSCRAMM family protein n=1 Tax=Listeria ilorinensis TaxID=2867439 RepID=UPI001EF4B7A6|nr:SdrD B-like domain-containing protein [Listeria ilorinensis]